MFHALRYSRTVWLGIGLLGGLIVGGIWPHTPLHAVATDSHDTYAIATGALDEDVEAIFFLDFLTGDLRAAALNKQSGKFTAFFHYNVLNDLGVDPAKNRRFLMVTGYVNLRRGAQVRRSRTVVYVAEISSGKVAAYAVPWDPSAHNMGRIIKQSFLPLDVTRFRVAAGAAGNP